MSSRDQFYWQQRELERVIGEMRMELPLHGHLSESLLRQIGALEHLRDRFMLPYAQIDALREIEKALAARPELHSLQRLVGLELPAMRAMQEQQNQIDKVLRDMGPAVSQLELTRRLAESLAPTEALLQTQSMSRALMEAVLQPQLAFQQFAQDQLRLAEAASGLLRANRLTAVDVSADLLESMHSGVSLAAGWSQELDSLRLDPVTDLNVFARIAAGIEALDLENDSVDVGTAIQDGSPARVASLGGQIITLVYNLNVEAERNGRPHVFKPTNKALRAILVISSHVAVDEHSFASIVDGLFFLLYEGSGSAARLTELVDASRLEALWALKRLRLAERHDLDHGGESDIKKKNQQVGAVFQGLIGKPMPKDADDWALAQAELYESLVAMLQDTWHSS